jgi:hypothetical protein
VRICDDGGVIGCILHWYTSAMYAVPVLGIMGWLKYVGWRDKRRGPGGPPESGSSAGAGRVVTKTAAKPAGSKPGGAASRA